MKIIESVNRGIEKTETYLVVIILTVMIVLSFAQVVLRNFWSQGILWGDILLRHLVLWVGFIGASLATREQKHINIDLFTRFLGKVPKTIIRLVINLFSALVCFLLADAGYTFVLDEKAMGTVLFGEIQAWYFQIIIPVGFLLMSLRFLFEAVSSIFSGTENTAEVAK